MNSKKNEKPFQTDLWEKWLESYFLDPFTSILDQTQFRVELYDSETEVIIEAMLPQHLSSQIDVNLDVSSVVIKVNSSKNPKERILSFPFHINSQKVEATFSNEILEIVISKIHQVKQINRNIPLI
ncbi:Hsp20/alpha crystallin family protein [Pseudoneobacillus rhizosphaerae]|uniref:Spore coat protein M n=1 Tax=Pseudoneobacillus rhizosphaerae TaxID=2880968 RepID=A0A9C7G5U1_9BACI|nr:Hsp20/alpha crystallin family protein [Pseudoneobacillus rhizosphaerae]CAG9606426.1 Spore coat protein M [Pseudoneobacillus rhizosphaerae]